MRIMEASGKKRYVRRMVCAILLCTMSAACSAAGSGAPASGGASSAPLSLSEDATEELATVSYALSRVLPKGSYQDSEAMWSVISKGGDALGMFLAYVYYGRAGEPYDLFSGGVSHSCTDVDPDTVKKLVAELFHAEIDFEKLPTIAGIAPAGAFYNESGKLTVYMGSSTGGISFANTALEALEDRSNFIVEIVKDGDPAGTVHLFLRPAENTYGAEIAGCEVL